MSNSWSRTKLGDILRPVERPEIVDAVRQYRILGVRWYGDGFFVKDTKLGQEIKAQKVYRVCKGDFAYNRLFAWKGSFAVAESDADGCYVSNEFPCFEPVEGRVDAGFLKWWFRRESAWLEALGLSSGATPTSRNRLKEQHFLAMEIPLPPPAEQRRIVARIEQLAGHIDEARTLHEQAAQEVETLLVAMAHRADLDPRAKEQARWKRTKLSNVARLVDDSQKVQVGRSYPNIGIYSFGRGLFRKPDIDGLATSAVSLRRITAGQFIYSRLFAFEGAYGIVTSEFDGAFVSQEYPTFECDPREVRPEFLEAYFRPSTVWKEVAVGSKGLGDRRQRVQPEQVLSHELWLPPLELQERLADVRAEAVAIKHLQSETAAELDALLPAILDRAFKGEL